MAKKKEKETEAVSPEAVREPPAGDAPAKGKKSASKETGGKGKKGVSDAPAKTDPAASPEVVVPPTMDAPAVGKSKKGKRPGVGPSLGKKLKNRLVDIREKLAKRGFFNVREAVDFLKQNKRAKFDETVEVHMSLGVDPKQNDQMIRGSVPLPHGIGKTVRLLVFTQGDNAAKAKEAGADFVGSDDLAKKIQSEGWLDFDAALATPDMMGVVGRLGKILGPRGLMPTPKAGTVITGDVAAAVREFKAGKVEYRTDAGGNVHAPVGKLSFSEDQLVGNIMAFIDQIKHAKPPSAKGNYVKSITISATMSPGVPVTA